MNKWIIIMTDKAFLHLILILLRLHQIRQKKDLDILNLRMKRKEAYYYIMTVMSLLVPSYIKLHCKTAAQFQSVDRLGKWRHNLCMLDINLCCLVPIDNAHPLDRLRSQPSRHLTDKHLTTKCQFSLFLSLIINRNIFLSNYDYSLFVMPPQKVI